MRIRWGLLLRPGGCKPDDGVCFCLFLLPAHPPHSPIEWQQGKVLFSVILGEGWTVQMLSKELLSVVFDEAIQLSACG